MINFPKQERKTTIENLTYNRLFLTNKSITNLLEVLVKQKEIIVYLIGCQFELYTDCRAV
jgi:hypothetical protein